MQKLLVELTELRSGEKNFTSYELKGPGAGKLETADAVMRDLLRILAKREIKTFYDAGIPMKLKIIWKTNFM
ncbi:Homoserine dehydrogenase [Peptoniphilus harei]|uniref:Homoserine dehydrogenase n=1 Tax=Peptoniphilus harei TaxID=54005 RepID=A0A2X1WMU7_9FIRM|nr:hypothetical protein [Peptoniphilus harei]SPY32187.1 Homoserine dehydrogenase [Peptoniphilus harei]